MLIKGYFFVYLKQSNQIKILDVYFIYSCNYEQNTRNICKSIKCNQSFSSLISCFWKNLTYKCYTALNNLWFQHFVLLPNSSKHKKQKNRLTMCKHEGFSFCYSFWIIMPIWRFNTFWGIIRKILFINFNNF